MKALTVVASVALCTSAYASVLWVDKTNGNNSTAAKDNESKPYATIQGAVGAASSGDEIRVKPGVYDEDSSYSATLESACRVFVNGKRLKIVSTDGPDVTHVVGVVDPSSNGLGNSAVRCFSVYNAPGTIIEGFTLRNGATRTTTSDTHPKCRGGAVMSVVIDSENNRSYAATNTFVVGCVVNNCYGERGAAFSGVTAVRCRIENNKGDNSGCAGRNASFINCLITGNRGAYTINYGDYVANCTMINNAGQILTSAGTDIKVINSIVLGNDGSNQYNVQRISLQNSLTFLPSGFNAELKGNSNSITNASAYQCVSPLTGDWRILRGSQAETAGDASLLEEVQAKLPEGVDAYIDLFGNEIPKTGPIAAGCCQTIADPLPYGGVTFTDAGTVLFDGKKLLGKKLYVCTDTWPTQYTFQAVNKGNPAIYSFVINSKYVFPTMDDTIYIAPTGMGTYVSCYVKDATATVYADPDKGSDSTKNGTNPETPYKTIQAAYVAAKNKGEYSVVRAAPGDYNSGGSVNSTVSNRLQMAYSVRVLGAGRDKSIIRGHPSPSTGGLGAYAMRCVYRSGGSGCVQGFTLTDGYTHGTSSKDTYIVRGGGVYANASSYDDSFRILDCTITNCYSIRGGAGYSGLYERCHITDCHALAGNTGSAVSAGAGGIVRYARLISCIVDNLDDVAMSSGTLYGRSYYSTFVGKTTGWVINKSDALLVNSIVVRCKSLTGPSSSQGCFAWEVPTMSVASITQADPKFVDLDGGDYHPTFVIDKREHTTYGSPTLGGGVWYPLSSVGVCLADFDGKPLNLIDGKPTAGAFQWPEVTVIKPGFYLILR